MTSRIFRVSLLTVLLCLAASAQTRRESLDEALTAVRKNLPNGSITNVLRIAFGDITYDGRNDAAVLVRREDVSLRVRDEIWIFALHNRRYVFLTKLSLKHPGDYVLSVASLGSNFVVSKGMLIFDHAVVGDKGAPPNWYKTVRYQWNGRSMIRNTASAPKPLPEHMREVG